MADKPGARTSENLLIRLRVQPTDQSAWAEFAARYSKKIYGWCRRWGAQDADASDVIQAVLLKLVRELRGFVYDPARSFRGWLKTLTHHAWYDLVKHRLHPLTDAGCEAERRLYDLEARADLAASVKTAMQDALNFALKRVRRRVHQRTWEAFRLTSLTGLSAIEAAAAVGVPLATVYKAKSNVQRLLREEIRQLQKSALR